MSHQPRNDLPEVKQMLQDRIVEVAANLLPRGRREGKEWVAQNPHMDEGRKAPALKVALTGNKGAWRDWRNGDKGDVIKLIEFSLSCTFKEAMDWARDFVGLRQMSSEERQKLRQQAAARVKREAAEADRRRLYKIKKAEELFFKGTAETFLMGGPELHARGYFAGRDCALDEVEYLSRRAFRFAAATEWWKGAEWKRPAGQDWAEKVKDGPVFPAVHSAMRALSGAITCCHVTFLDPVLPKKAGVEPPKLMFGEALGAVIEVSTGPGGLDFWDAEAKPLPLIIAEGIETALSLAKAIPEARVWAGGSLAGMGHAPVRLPCIADITVARDNNVGNPQAQSQLAQALARLEEADKPLQVMQSHVGDDFNDLMTGDDDD